MSKQAKPVVTKEVVPTAVAAEEKPRPRVAREPISAALFGWEKCAPGRYLAVKHINGKRMVLTPKRFDSDYGESFALTVQRIISEMRETTR